MELVGDGTGIWTLFFRVSPENVMRTKAALSHFSSLPPERAKMLFHDWGPESPQGWDILYSCSCNRGGGHLVQLLLYRGAWLRDRVELESNFGSLSRLCDQGIASSNSVMTRVGLVGPEGEEPMGTGPRREHWAVSGASPLLPGGSFSSRPQSLSWIIWWQRTREKEFEVLLALGHLMLCFLPSRAVCSNEQACGDGRGVGEPTKKHRNQQLQLPDPGPSCAGFASIFAFSEAPSCTS